jgi:tRNA(Ile2) C34 agmatinyltransferase TiaS
MEKKTMSAAKLKKKRSKDSESMAVVTELEAVMKHTEEPEPMTKPTFAELHRLIAEAAYYRALARDFVGGNADEDWYAAEAEIKQAHSY